MVTGTWNMPVATPLGHSRQPLASMSRTGDCYDNAVAESLFSTLEFELLSQSDWQTREEARHAIFRYIEGCYNPRRRHSTLGYVCPAAYEEQVREAA